MNKRKHLRLIRLNDAKIKAQRRELIYEAVMLDLLRIGALPKDTVEDLLDADIPEYLLDKFKKEKADGASEVTDE